MEEKKLSPLLLLFALVILGDTPFGAVQHPKHSLPKSSVRLKCLYENSHSQSSLVVGASRWCRRCARRRPHLLVAEETLTPWWLNLVFMLRYLLGGVVVWALLSTVADNAEAIHSSKF